MSRIQKQTEDNYFSAPQREREVKVKVKFIQSSVIIVRGQISYKELHDTLDETGFFFFLDGKIHQVHTEPLVIG